MTDTVFAFGAGFLSLLMFEHGTRIREYSQTHGLLLYPLFCVFAVAYVKDAFNAVLLVLAYIYLQRFALLATTTKPAGQRECTISHCCQLLSA